jgi:adenosylhomocysteinase
MSEFARELDWARTHSPLTRRQCAVLPDLHDARIAFSIHLDIKMVVAIEGVMARGAEVFLTTCNPTTVRDPVVAHLRERGAVARAQKGMSAHEFAAAIEEAIAWKPTHLCEMGAELTQRIHQGEPVGVKAGLEATGSGITRIRALSLRYPVFNWDDLPIKEGLHNRWQVGLATWQAFCARTRLSLHRKHVVVVGFGLVGQGLAESARAFGAQVTVVERDPVRLLEARYGGWHAVEPAPPAIGAADVVVTATGVRGVIGAAEIAALRDGAFLLNAGHLDDEIDVAALGPRREVLPFIEEARPAGKLVYLFAGGSMANLTAGEGDSLNTFDVTLATMVAGLGHIVTRGAAAPPGIHLLPRDVWGPVAAEAAAHSG